MPMDLLRHLFGRRPRAGAALVVDGDRLARLLREPDPFDAAHPL